MTHWMMRYIRRVIYSASWPLQSRQCRNRSLRSPIARFGGLRFYWVSSKPETTYITAVHRLLPPRVHKEKIFNPYRGGTADVWYSGTLDDLWVEYKYVANVPKKAAIDVSKLLSSLQIDWLNKRALEGRNVVVILGTPIGSWVFESRAWNGQIAVTRHDLITLGRSRQEIADYIRRRVMLHESD